MLMHHYSTHITGQRVAIFGIMPPPLGGVSVHIARVAAQLQKQGNKVFHFLTLPRNRHRFFAWYVLRMLFFLFRHRPTVVQYHTSYVSTSAVDMVLLVLLKKVLRYSLTFIEHDPRHLAPRYAITKRLLRFAYQHTDHTVLIGNSTREHYVQHGMFIERKMSTESAFLPPDTTQAEAIIATYSQELKSFLATHHPVVLANATHVALIDGKDLYGFDTTLTLLAELKKEYQQVGLVLAVANVGDQRYYAQLNARSALLGVQDNVYFLFEQKELWPLMKLVDLFVRPTLSDSFGISVAEAVVQGTPALASNVCERYPGTVVYEVGNSDDFIIKAQEMIRERCKANNE